MQKIAETNQQMTKTEARLYMSKCMIEQCIREYESGNNDAYVQMSHARCA